MCSAIINAASSCYLDDFTKIFGALMMAVVFSVYVGLLVGILIRVFRD